MKQKVTKDEISKLSLEFKIAVPKIQAFRKVESGMKGYDDVTGKILIQFEPHWVKRLAPFTPSGKWSINKVEKQAAEWLAFNDAFSKNADVAMQATSWGSMQVMGFNFKRLGFKSVGAMVDFAKESEYNQVWLGLKYIATDKVLYKALQEGDWEEVALRYNGKDYYILGYHIKLQNAEVYYKSAA